jgi:hypothetical protein
MIYPATPIAFLMFFSWPLVTIVLFATLRRPLAASVTLIGGILLLPERLVLTIPLIPSLDKYGLVTICALIGSAAKGARVMARASSGSKWRIGLMSINSVITVFMNPDPMRFGAVILPALDFAAIRHYLLSDLIGFAFPVWVGESVFRTLDDLRDFLKVLVIGGILYTPLMLIELRLSPQLHTWVYGFYPHEFAQAMRAGGFRSNVFLVHPLTLSKTIEECAVAALILRLLGQKIFGLNAGVWAAWLLVMLVLNKSLAALIYGAFCFVMILWTSPKLQVKVSVVLLSLVLAYPVLRANGWFPTEMLVGFTRNEEARETAEDRGQSLEFRFENEDLLLAHVMKRPFFGWGGHGRNATYEAKTGQKLTVTDGSWIIELGTRGFVGAFVWWMWLAAPILAARRRLFRDRGPPEVAVLSGCVLLLGTTWVDLLPNAGPMVYLWVLAGAVVGILRSAPQPALAGFPGMMPQLPLQPQRR